MQETYANTQNIQRPIDSSIYLRNRRDESAKGSSNMTGKFKVDKSSKSIKSQKS